MRRHLIVPGLVAAAAVALGACSSDAKSDNTSSSSAPAVSAATAADPAASTVQSSVSGDGGTATASGSCALVPGVADIESIVGVTVDDGVSASDGVCAFTDAEATTSISFTSVTDPTLVANFAALGADAGAADLNDEALPGAKSQFGTVLYADGDTLYSVSVTSHPRSDDALQQSTALMELWVSGD